MLWSMIGDLDYLTSILKLPNHGNASNCCCLCRASLSGSNTWSNFRSNAPWRAHMLPHRSRNHLFSFPGEHFERTPGLDALQVFRHGSICFRIRASSSGLHRYNARRWQRARQAEPGMARDPSIESTRWPSGTSTPESFVHVLATERLPQTPWQSSGNPLLHLPAGRPVAGPPQSSPGSASADSLALLQANMCQEDLLTQHRSEVALVSEAATLFEDACHTMLCLHAQIAQHYSAKASTSPANRMVQAHSLAGALRKPKRSTS